MFFDQNPEAVTQLGWALKFYDISFLYDPTPQAKGKIEREHQFWQGRLPPYFSSEQITDIETGNPHIHALHWASATIARVHGSEPPKHARRRLVQQAGESWERKPLLVFRVASGRTDL